jgi:L-ascorbate metabolism protein UlaG (beta-lactamase superfamily)
VIVTHNHYDHLDIPTLKTLVQRDRPLIFVALGNRELLDKNDVVGSREMDWWQATDIRPGVSLTFVPAQHFSGRGTKDRNQTLWGGYVIRSGNSAVYYAGDTGWGPQFEQIRDRFGPVRLAILPIGAFRPKWFMSPVHISPEEAVRAHTVLGAQTSMGVHFGTFKLADDGQDEPVTKLAKALQEQNISPETFWVLGFGEGRMVAPFQQSLATADSSFCTE